MRPDTSDSGQLNNQQFDRILTKKAFFEENRHLFASWSQFETQIKNRFTNGLDAFNAVLKPSGLVYIDQVNYLDWLYNHNRLVTDDQTPANSQENPLDSSIVEGCLTTDE